MGVIGESPGSGAIKVRLFSAVVHNAPLHCTAAVRGSLELIFLHVCIAKLILGFKY